jgi:predicted RecA/RadA family phage recombinase
MAGTSDNDEMTMSNLVAPTGGVTVGTCYLIGGVLVMAMTAADAAATFTGKYRGKLKGVTKTAGTGKAWTAGATLYWDNSAKSWTTTATGNTKKGYADAIAAASATVGDVRLAN